MTMRQNSQKNKTVSWTSQASNNIPTYQGPGFNSLADKRIIKSNSNHLLFTSFQSYLNQNTSHKNMNMTTILISIFLLAIMLVGGNAQQSCWDACADRFSECIDYCNDNWDQVGCANRCSLSYNECVDKCEIPRIELSAQAVSTLADQKLYLRRRRN